MKEENSTSYNNYELSSVVKNQDENEEVKMEVSDDNSSVESLTTKRTFVSSGSSKRVNGSSRGSRKSKKHLDLEHAEEEDVVLEKKSDNKITMGGIGGSLRENACTFFFEGLCINHYQSFLLVLISIGFGIATVSLYQHEPKGSWGEDSAWGIAYYMITLQALIISLSQVVVGFFWYGSKLIVLKLLARDTQARRFKSVMFYLVTVGNRGVLVLSAVIALLTFIFVVGGYLGPEKTGSGTVYHDILNVHITVLLFTCGLLVSRLILLRLTKGFDTRVFLDKIETTMVDEMVLTILLQLPLSDFNVRFLGNKIEKGDRARSYAASRKIQKDSFTLFLKKAFLDLGIKVRQREVVQYSAKYLFNKIKSNKEQKKQTFIFGPRTKLEAMNDKSDDTITFQEFSQYCSKLDSKENSVDSMWKIIHPSSDIVVEGFTRSMLELTIENMSNNRINLAQTLHDAEDVKSTLENVIIGLITFILAFPTLGFFGIDLVGIWVGISSIILAFTFVFGNTIKGMFESAFFVFGIHPYDVGDNIWLTIEERKRYLVKKITLMTTVLVGIDGSMVRVENANIKNLPLSNISTSGANFYFMSVELDAACINEQFMTECRQEALELVRAYPDIYTKINIQCRGWESKLKVKLACVVMFTFNEEDPRWWPSISETNVKLNEIIIRNGATYHDPARKSFSSSKE